MTGHVELPTLPSTRLILVSVLGEGATSDVYRAWMVDIGDWCAVKVLKAGRSEQIHRRFLTEAELLCQLSHRNLIKGYEVVDGAPPFFVMEIADGGSLKDWCVRFGKMPPRLAVEVAIQVAKGVAVAHQSGFVHRDIKPHNILVNRRGACKLTDFGVARASRSEGDESVTVAGDALGTLGYMAPEQQSFPSGVDERSDVYGIAATLVHLLTGNHPPGNLFMAVTDDPALLEGLSPELAAVIRKATSYDRELRQPSVMALARELHALWEFLPVAQGPTLTTGIPLEPPPPPGMVSRGSIEGSLSPTSKEDAPRPPISIPPFGTELGSHSIPPSDPARPVSLESLRRAATPSPSSLRRSFLPEPEPVERTHWWLVGLGFASIVFLLFSLDVYWVGSAKSEATEAQQGFAEVAQRNVAVIEELGRLGANREELAASYAATRTGTPAARRDAAERWVTEVRSATGAYPADPRVSQVLSARLAELEASLGPLNDAVAEWDLRSRAFPGTLVSRLLGRPDTATADDR